MGIFRVVTLGVVPLLASLTGCAALFPYSEQAQELPEPHLIGACNPTPCIRAAIGDVPDLPEGLSPEVQELVSSAVSAVLYAPLESDEKQGNDEKLLSELVDRYEEVEEGGLSDAAIDWEITRNATVLYQSAAVLTVEVRSEGFVGGAHGFNDRTLLTFDLRDGKRLALKDLIEPKSEGVFQGLVEAQFRRAREIPPRESLADAGYFVKSGDPMLVPENFGITPGGLLVQYNPYEIAPYSFGPTQIVVPTEAFAGVLKGDAKPLIEPSAQEKPKA